MQDGFGRLAEAVQQMRGGQRQEALRVAAPPSFAAKWLVGRLSRFSARHPGLDIVLSADPDLIDEGHGPDGIAVAPRSPDIDLAIWFGAGHYPGSRVDKLFDATAVPLCSPRLLAGETALGQPDDLRHHTLLHVVTESSDSKVVPLEWPAWLQAVGASAFEAEATLTFSTYDTAVAAALEGQGVLLGRRPLTDSLLEQGRLVAPFMGQLASARGYFVVLDAVAARRPAVAALVSWLHAMARGIEAPVPAGGQAAEPAATASAAARRPSGRAKVLAGQ